MPSKLLPCLLVTFVTCALLPAAVLVAWAADPPPVSEGTQECLDCHEFDTPGIVADWRTSRHANTTPALALEQPALSRRISGRDVPDRFLETAVGCFECHGQRAEAHPDTFEHNGYQLHTVVSPDDCRTCHPVEAAQYSTSKKAHAVGILDDNPVYHLLVETVTRPRTLGGDGLASRAPTPGTRAWTCYACHGTRVAMRGLKTVESAAGDEVSVPDLSGWPNNGVGRINPDGSRGACTSCHPRHGFSIAVARSPETCAQCHLYPDVPAWEVYKESKHGNLVLSGQAGLALHEVPWRVGTDFRAPTCATCHNALVTTPDGEFVIAERTHDFGARLWVRVFGLIYAHPQPLHGDTSRIRNADGMPLPTTFGGEPASEYLIDAGEQAQRRAAMRQICQGCHGASWAGGHFDNLDGAIADADAMVAAATGLMQQAWEWGLADPENPFDEPLERKWVAQWLFYANGVRYGAAMGGPDYASFKGGWWALSGNLAEMREAVQATHGAGK